MRRQVPVSQQVYKALFPYPMKNVDPLSWSEYVKKSLIPEVRSELQMFFGDEVSTVEGIYPGLNYALPAHRLRLKRFTNHRRLFRAFDELGLTQYEIYKLCDWDGTLLARHRYEAEHFTRIRDTTADEVITEADLALAMAASRVSLVHGEESEAMQEKEAEEGDVENEQDETTIAEGRPPLMTDEEILASPRFQRIHDLLHRAGTSSEFIRAQLQYELLRERNSLSQEEPTRSHTRAAA